MKPNVSMDRRTLLKTAAAAGAATAAGAIELKAPFVITARAEEAIKLGVLLPKSGPYTVQGENGRNGAHIAVDDFNGRVLDRPVQIVWLDEPNPQTTQQNMHKLVEEEKVVAVQGGISSGDVLAIMPIADRAKILLMATGPNATEITGKNCNRYTSASTCPTRSR
jgi:branched-chain amino acid transport system substrate-binding protein